MFEMFHFLINETFSKGFIYFGNQLIIMIEEYFTLNIYWELHVYIILCFVLIIRFCLYNLLN